MLANFLALLFLTVLARSQLCDGPTELTAATTCTNGVLVANTSVSATIPIVVLVSPVVVNGNFSWIGENMTIPYVEGNGAILKVNGTANLSGSGTFTLNVTTPLAPQNRDIPIAQADYFATTFTKPTIISVEDKPGCSKYTGEFSNKSNGSKRDLSVLLTDHRCRSKKSRKWIVPVAVVCGVILVAIVIAVVIFVLHKRGLIGRDRPKSRRVHDVSVA